MIIRIGFVFCLLVSMSVTARPAEQPQPNDGTLQSVRHDMDELIKGQIELQKQMEELKSMMQAIQARPTAPPAPAPPTAHPPPTNVLIDVAGAAQTGNPDAPIVLIEFSDFQCPFCAKYEKETFAKIDQEFIKTGKISYVFRDY